MFDRLNPRDVVLRFLELMEQRDLASAEQLLTHDFEMVFPGSSGPPGPFRPKSLTQLVEWAQTRYRFVRKTLEHVDSINLSDTQAVVYCSGTLHGEWIDGSPFQGIRFIDRFELQDLKIRHQSVWNDMALHLR